MFGLERGRYIGLPGTLQRDAGYWPVVWLLRFAHLPFKAHDLHAVFAQRAVHVGTPLDALVRTLQEEVGDVWMHPHVMGREHLDLRMARRQGRGSIVNALHENAIEEQKWQHDEALLTQARGGAQAVGDERLGGAGVTHKGGAKAHALFEHSAQLGDFRIGIRIGRAAPDHHEARVGASEVARRLRLGLHNTLLRQAQE